MNEIVWATAASSLGWLDSTLFRPSSASHIAGSERVEPFLLVAGELALIWQRSLPLTYDGCSGKYASDGVAGDACIWEDAKKYCASSALAAALGGSGWRLPTKIELESIVDETRSNPAIDPIFANMPAQGFWTASPFVSSADSAWYVHNGGSYHIDVSAACRVRCVR